MDVNMAFDGFAVAALVGELKDKIQDGHIQKISQPESDEIILSIKKNRIQHRLLISASASLPLIGLTNETKPSPLTAPNFCMLLRKHLGGARLLAIEQIGLERVVRLQFENLNELGDIVSKSLMVEIMGKHSNIILIDKNKRIIDSIKHINSMVSSVREVLPGREYFIPNTQEKKDPYTLTTSDWNDYIFKKPVSVTKALYSSITGFSATISHEIAYRAGIDGDAPIASLNGNDKSSLMTQFRSIMDRLLESDFCPCIIFRGSDPIEFCAFSLTMYPDCESRRYSSMSEVIDTFYGEKELIGRIRQKSVDLRKTVTTLLDRNYKKLDIQKKQLKDTDKKDRFRIYGELLNTYGYQIVPGEKSYTCINYYDEKEITIPLKTTMSPSENANRYFDKYNKMKRTAEALARQIDDSEETIEHLESIITELDIARREEDLVAIRRELVDYGYIKSKNTNSKKSKVKKSNPLHFVSSDGYDIYVGKNNYQNDELTFKIATGNDWWFHAKDMPGSHVILRTNGQDEPPIKAFEEAASLAAYFSKGKNADKVEVDYTRKKNIKKPAKSKPGFVVYYTNYSIMASSSIEGIRCADEKDRVFLERSYLK